MKHYILDGNNLIGKIPELFNIQKKDPQSSRVKLAYMIDNYFSSRKEKVSLHFDGFSKDVIKINNAKIIYSDNKSADEKIKIQIEKSKNTRQLIVVTSDNNLAQFAKVCSCKVIASDSFAKIIVNRAKDDESSIIDELRKSSGEFEKLFGVDDT